MFWYLRWNKTATSQICVLSLPSLGLNKRTLGRSVFIKNTSFSSYALIWLRIYRCHLFPSCKPFRFLCYIRANQSLLFTLHTIIQKWVKSNCMKRDIRLLRYTVSTSFCFFSMTLHLLEGNSFLRHLQRFGLRKDLMHAGVENLVYSSILVR